MTARVGLTGGCACGRVRYRLDAAPYDAGYCHCRLCQRSAGAPSNAFATVPFPAFVVTAGALRWRRSTDFGRRGFCADCGTQLTIDVEFQADEIDFTIASLDDLSAVEPGFHIFWAERVPWLRPVDDLPRYAGWRPDTRGLNDGPASRPSS